MRATGQQVSELRTGAAVGNVRDEHAGNQLQVFHGQMAGAGIAGRAVIELAGVLLGVGHELFEVGRWHIRVNHEHIGHFGQQRHRHKVFVDVVGLVFQHVGVHGQRTHMAQDDGVAVRRRFGNVLHRCDAGATGLVFHKDRLA